MEDNNLHSELENLRRQMMEFKSQLDKQKIVNEQMITASMKKNISWIRKYIIFEVCIVPLVAIIWLAMKTILGLSWFNYIFLLVMLIVDVYIDYRINISAISDEDYHKSNLVTTTTKLSNMKRQRRLSLQIFLPLLIIWIIWCVVEMSYNQANNASEMARSMMYGNYIGLCIGTIIGVFVGLYIYGKMQKTNDELINQIRELTEQK